MQRLLQTTGMIIFLIIAVPGWCAESSRLTISQCIEKAVRQNPKLRAMQYEIIAAKERVTQAQSGFYPQVSFSQSFSRTDNPMWAFGTRLNQERITSADFDPNRLNSPEDIQNFVSTVSVIWTLFDSGQTWYGTRQAKIADKIASLMSEQARQQTIAQAAIGYAGLLLCRETLNVIEQSLNLANANAKVVRSRFENGFVVKSDMLRANVRIAELEQAKFQAESQFEISCASLNAIMGEPSDSRYEFVTPLDMLTHADQSYEYWLDLAMSKRSDYQAIIQKYAMTEEEVKKAEAAHLPSLSLFGNYEVNSEKFSETGDNYTIGAMVKINAFSGFRDAAKVNEAKAMLNQVGLMRQDAEANIRVETRQAYANAKSAWQRIEVAKAAWSQSEEGLKIVSDRYKNGLLTIVHLMDAEVALEQSRKNLYQAYHDYKVASARLALAAGVIDENFAAQ
jgi:outer membrane protein TolC